MKDIIEGRSITPTATKIILPIFSCARKFFVRCGDLLAIIAPVTPIHALMIARLANLFRASAGSLFVVQQDLQAINLQPVIYALSIKL
jgi:hypothetical protein